MLISELWIRVQIHEANLLRIYWIRIRYISVKFKILFDDFRVGQRTEELVAGAPGPDPRGSWSRSVALRFLRISLLPKHDRGGSHKEAKFQKASL
jgi:hypothetical protein